LIGALVIYMLYNNLMSVINNWVGQEKVALSVGMLGIHSVIVMLTLVLFYYRMSVFSWRRIKQ
jgi:lipopolysaccharide export system permease protein